MSTSKSITVRLDEDTAAKLEALLAHARNGSHPIWRGYHPSNSDLVRSASSLLYIHEGEPGEKPACVSCGAVLDDCHSASCPTWPRQRVTSRQVGVRP